MFFLCVCYSRNSIRFRANRPEFWPVPCPSCHAGYIISLKLFSSCQKECIVKQYNHTVRFLIWKLLSQNLRVILRIGQPLWSGVEAWEGPYCMGSLFFQLLDVGRARRSEGRAGTWWNWWSGYLTPAIHRWYHQGMLMFNICSSDSFPLFGKNLLQLSFDKYLLNSCHIACV